jgi:glycosyltransferase involved in cell wall biosynthesis
MPRPLEALFVSEGALGADVLGHVRAEDSSTALLASDVHVRVTRLPAMGAAVRAAVHDVPGLRRIDLDLAPVRWHLAQGLRLRRALAAGCRGGPVDVVYVNTHTLALFAQRELSRLPTVLMADASVWAWQSMGIWRPVRRHSRTVLAPSLHRERRALANARRVLALTAWSADTLRDAQPAANITVHHPGLDLDRFRPAERAPRPSVRVLFVGARFVHKGGPELIAALAPRLGRDVELDIVSPAPIEARPGLRVHRLAPDDSRLVELFQQADLLCLPTRGDATPWVVLEAMACGTPVLATAVGGIPDLIGDEGGRTVARGDQTALAAALDELLADEDQRAALGRAARARCERCYDARLQGPMLGAFLREAADVP